VLGMADCIQLIVSDAGAGFDVEAVKKNSGLGLVSMQERVHQIHGSFSVESRPGQGTKILVVVPLHSENEPPDDKKSDLAVALTESHPFMARVILQSAT
jgi:signal transduction histidine kinase